MAQGKPTRAKADTTRLKRDIARNDSTVRAMTRAMAQMPEAEAAMLMPAARAAHATSTAKQDTLRMYRTPTVGHKSFAQHTKGFDGRALTSESNPKPPRMAIPLGHPTPDKLPSATGTPALAQRASGLDNIRADYKTFEAGSTRPEASSGRGTRAAVSSFVDDRV